VSKLLKQEEEKYSDSGVKNTERVKESGGPSLT
jgi:hypothetical protein